MSSVCRGGDPSIDAVALLRHAAMAASAEIASHLNATGDDRGSPFHSRLDDRVVAEESETDGKKTPNDAIFINEPWASTASKVQTQPPSIHVRCPSQVGRVPSRGVGDRLRPRPPRRRDTPGGPGVALCAGPCAA